MTERRKECFESVDEMVIDIHRMIRVLAIINASDYVVPTDLLETLASLEQNLGAFAMNLYKDEVEHV